MTYRPGPGLTEREASGAFPTRFEVVSKRLVVSGSIVVPANVTTMPYRLAGGGAGGGGGGSALTSGGVTAQVGGGGGAAGSVIEGVLGVIPGETLTLTVGAGGAPGGAGAVNGGAGSSGGNGGLTTIARGATVLVSAPGGQAGAGGGANSTSQAAGGAYGGLGTSTLNPPPAGNGGYAGTTGVFAGSPTLGGTMGGSGGAPATASNGGNGGKASTGAPGVNGSSATGTTSTTAGGAGATPLNPGCGGGGGGGGAPGGVGGAGGAGSSGYVDLAFTPTYTATSGSAATRHGLSLALQSPGQSWNWQADLFDQDRFELRPGDMFATDDPTRNRVEWAHTVTYPYGSDIWFSGSLYIEAGAQIPPADATSGPVGYWCLFTQFHQTADAGDYQGASPPFEVRFTPGDVLKFSSRGTSEDPLTQPTAGAETTFDHYSATIPRGVWQNFVFRLRPTKGTPDAQLDVWHNGTQVASVTGIVCGYNDVAGVVGKYGIYRRANGITQAIRWANVEISSSSLLSRVASPLPVTGP